MPYKFSTGYFTTLCLCQIFVFVTDDGSTGLEISMQYQFLGHTEAIDLGNPNTDVQKK